MTKHWIINALQSRTGSYNFFLQLCLFVKVVQLFNLMSVGDSIFVFSTDHYTFIFSHFIWLVLLIQHLNCASPHLGVHK